MDDKILFVDDEPLVLDGYKRMLHREFEVDTAVGGEAGLLSIRDHGPYSVVVSDMRMPGMNGAQFLAQMRKTAPETVRMLLTGYTDLGAAIDAVNEGNIFRFLTKPCDRATLVEALKLGVAQHHTAVAEKEILEKAKTVQCPASDLNASDVCQWDNREGPTGLPGPTQARACLTPHCGVDPQCYVVLFKLPVLQTIEQRYGGEAASDYLNFIAQFLMQSLRSDDLLFHWGWDVLMAVVQRQNSVFSTRLEVARITIACHEYLIEKDGRSIMIANLITNETFSPVQYKTFDEMVAAFDAKLTAKI